MSFLTAYYDAIGSNYRYRPSEPSEHSDPTRMCKYCGKKGLKWVNTTHGWRLSEEGKQHQCVAYQGLVGAG